MRYFAGILFFMIVGLNIIYTQQLPDQAGFKDYNNNLKTQNTVLRPKPYEAKLENSPLLFDDFQKGFVVSKSGEKIILNQANYNVLLKQLVFKDNGEIFSIDDSYFDSLFVFKDNQFEKYCFKKIGNNHAPTLVRVLTDGPFPLYSFIEASLIQPDYNPVMMTGNKDFTIKTKKQFYFFDNGQIKPLPKRAKKVLASKDFSREFRSLVRKKNPKLKKEKDILVFFAAINIEIDEQS